MSKFSDEVYDLAAAFAEPFPLLFLAWGATLAWLGWRSAVRKSFLAHGVIYLFFWLLATPVVEGLARWSYEPDLPDWPTSCQAIVVLGGAIRPSTLSPHDLQLGDDTILRCLTAVELSRELPSCPVVVSGGVTTSSVGVPPLAEAMGLFLRRFDLPEVEVIEEPKSRTTYENAVECAAMLRERGIGRVALVTHALHMPRAAACFRAQGIEVAPVGCRKRVPVQLSRFRSWLPSLSSFKGLTDVWHEWLGIAWYEFEGRI